MAFAFRKNKTDADKPLVVQQAHRACPEPFPYCSQCFLAQLVDGFTLRIFTILQNDAIMDYSKGRLGHETPTL